MLAKTPDDDTSDLMLLTSAFLDADAGGPPPVDTIVAERPRRKPPRYRVLESVLDDNGQRVVRVTAAPGFVIDNVILQEYDGKKCNCAVVLSPSRGKPRGGDRIALAEHARILSARRAAKTSAVTNGAGPNGTNRNSGES
jgi:hypothetical protein